MKVVHARSFFDRPSKQLAVEIGQFGRFLREYLKVSDGRGHGLSFYGQRFMFETRKSILQALIRQFYPAVLKDIRIRI